MSNLSDIDLIEQYIAGKLSPAEKMNFEFRLEDDRELARKLRMRQNFPSLFKAQGDDTIGMDVTQELSPSDTLLKKRNPLRWIIPLFLLLLVSGALIYYYVSQDSAIPSPKPPAVVSKKKPATPPIPAKQIKPVTVTRDSTPQEKSPVTSPALKTAPPAEKQGSPTRSPVELISPANHAEVLRSQEIVFQWKMATDSFTNFYLYSAGHKLAIWRGVPPGIRQIRLEASKFKPGEFYWYVGDKSFQRNLIIRE